LIDIDGLRATITIFIFPIATNIIFNILDTRRTFSSIIQSYNSI